MNHIQKHCQSSFRVSNVAGLAGPTTLEKCSSEKKQMILKLNTIEGLMKAMTEFVKWVINTYALICL